MKKNLGPLNCMYPMPMTLVGAQVSGRANFMAIAHVGIMNYGQPQYITIGSNKTHETNRGIKENGTFSVNIPSEDLVVETDYTGLVSGKSTDKSGLFEVFYGETRTAPMVSECKVSMECRLHQTLDFKTHEIFVGEIVASYCDEDVMTEGAVDLAKVRPMLFDMPTRRYWKLGEPLAQAWDVGKQLKK